MLMASDLMGIIIGMKVCIIEITALRYDDEIVKSTKDGYWHGNIIWKVKAYIMFFMAYTTPNISMR